MKKNQEKDNYRLEAPFDFLGSETRNWPYFAYQILRNDCVQFSETMQCWLISGYHEVKELLHHSDISATAAGYADGSLAQWLLFSDPPYHKKIRTLIRNKFSLRQINDLKQQIDDLTKELVFSLKKQAEIDLVQDLFYPLTLITITRVIGLPEQDFRYFQECSNQIVQFIECIFSSEEITQKGLAKMKELNEYVDNLIREERFPPDSILAILLKAEQKQLINRSNLNATIIMLLVTGHKTSVGLLGNGLKALLQNEKEWCKLKAQPKLMRSAIEELLRFDTPVQTVLKVALQDIAINDKIIKEGEFVLLLMGSANHDTRVFEKPEKLMIDREPNLHFSFGHGIHYCLGSILAKLQIEAVLETIMNELPHIQLTKQDFAWSIGTGFRRLEKLKVMSNVEQKLRA